APPAASSSQPGATSSQPAPATGAPKPATTTAGPAKLAWPTDAVTIAAAGGSGTTPAVLKEIRAGRQDGYDRLVLEFTAPYGKQLSIMYSPYTLTPQTKSSHCRGTPSSRWPCTAQSRPTPRCRSLRTADRGRSTRTCPSSSKPPSLATSSRS